MERLVGVIGIFAFLGMAYLLSANRRQISWRVVIWGTILQWTFALFALGIPALGVAGPLRFAFNAANDGVNKVLDYTIEGSRFIFGDLMDTEKFGFIFAFQVLPTIIFMAALMAVLYQLGVMQPLVKGLAIVMQKFMGTSGAESLSAAANIFVGQTEAPLVVKPFVKDMTQSELLAVMVGGMASVAGGVLAAYTGMLRAEIPDIAGHLLTVLTQFGQDEPGQEVLGLLLNHLLTYVGSTGPDADFLRGLFARYPLKTKPISARDMPDWRGHESPTAVQEKIIGENTLRDVRLLELALDAARAVVRIVTADSLGSGFLVGEGLIMTNHHVIGGREAAQPSAFQFNYQLDKQLHPLPILAARAKPDGLFYTNPDLDVTVVEVLDAPTDVAPLTLARRRAKKDGRVNIIQHPGGHYKKISMQNNFVAFADGRHLQYLTSTEPGSSGSPVFDNDFLVIGIHHSGGMLPEPGGEQKYLRNAGSSMIAVLDDLRDHAPEIYARLSLG